MTLSCLVSRSGDSQRLESHGHKYAQLSLLIGGILMLVLGVLLIIDPSFLVL
jgi:hypothetical protein